MGRILTLVVALVLVQTVSAQLYIGYVTSNYAGYHSTLFNPAAIAQTPYAVDVNVFSGNVGFDNDFAGLNNEGFFASKTLSGSYEDFADFADRALLIDFDQNVTGGQSKFYLGADALGPSALVPLSSNSAIGFGVRFRNAIQMDNLGTEAARLAMEAFEYPPLWEQDFESDGVRFSAMNWVEYQASYARQIYQSEDEAHYLAAGLTVKLIQGLHALYLYSDDLNYNFTSDDFLSISKSNLAYGHSEGFALNDPLRNLRFDDLGFGMDLGFVYEWRPDGDAYNGKNGVIPDVEDRSAIRYRLKAAFALTDIGSITFNRNPGTYDHPDGSIDLQGWDLTEVNFDRIGDFDDTLSFRFPDASPSSGTSFTMTLPRSLTAQIDYHALEGLYIGLSGWWSPLASSDPTKVHGISRIVLNPRYEMRWFGGGIPLSYQSYSGIDAGIFLRLGPVILGSANFFTNALGKKVSGADMYLAMRIPILHRQTAKLKVEESDVE